jgi:archaellum component FlaF (FlaF/FlaG flagellin family)
MNSTFTAAALAAAIHGDREARRRHRVPQPSGASGMSRLLAVLVLLCGAVHAAEPVFKPTIVTASSTYERESGSFSVAGFPAGSKTVNVSRVTVNLEGLLVTAEWEPKTVRSVTANDFRRGTDVQVAIDRNRLLLKQPDGNVVTAKIVSREKAKPAESGRQTRD